MRGMHCAKADTRSKQVRRRFAKMILAHTCFIDITCRFCHELRKMRTPSPHDRKALLIHLDRLARVTGRGADRYVQSHCTLRAATFPQPPAISNCALPIRQNGSGRVTSSASVIACGQSHSKNSDRPVPTRSISRAAPFAVRVPDSPLHRFRHQI